MQAAKRSSLMFKDNVTSEGQNDCLPSRNTAVVDFTSFTTVSQIVKKPKPEKLEPIVDKDGCDANDVQMDDSASVHFGWGEGDDGASIEDDAMSGTTVLNPKDASMWQGGIEKLDPYAILVEMTKRRQISDSPVDQLIPVKVVSYETPTSFYVQLKDGILDPIFEHLGDELEKEVSNYLDQLNGYDTTFEKGETAIVMFQGWRESTIYLRCTVDDVVYDSLGKVDSYQVTCIDFGKKINPKPCNLVKSPLEIFTKIPPFAFHCSLANIFPSGSLVKWQNESIKAFNEFANKHEKYFIWVKKDLPPERPDPILVNLITKKDFVPGPFHPTTTKFITAIDQLSNDGLCLLRAESLSGPFDAELLNGTSLNEVVPRAVVLDSNVAIPSNFKNLIGKHNERKNEWYTVDVFQYLPPEKPSTSQFNLKISNVSIDGKIHGRIEPLVGDPQLPKVNKKIYEALNFGLTPLPQFDVSDYLLNRAVSAIYPEDGTTNRAAIIGVGNKLDTFRVRFIDYGQEAELKADKIFTAVFCPKIPALAHTFELYEIEFQPGQKANVVHELYEALVDRVCSITWENAYYEPMKVTIEAQFGQEDEMKNINQLLIENHLAFRMPDMDAIPTKVSDIREILAESPYVDHQISFLDGVYYRLTCGMVFCKNYIFLQHRSTEKEHKTKEEARILKQEENFLKIQNQINADTSSFKQVGSQIEFKRICLAMSSLDNQFYRAIIIDSDLMPSKNVFFVDYGNIEKVHIDRIREIPAHFVKRVPVHCFLIRVCNIRPRMNKQWSDVRTAMQKQLDHLGDTGQLIGKFSFQRIGNQHEPVVDLFAAESDDSDVPVKHAFADLVKEGLLEYIDRNAINPAYT